MNPSDGNVDTNTQRNPLQQRRHHNVEAVEQCGHNEGTNNIMATARMPPA